MTSEWIATGTNKIVEFGPTLIHMPLSKNQYFFENDIGQNITTKGEH